MPLLQTAFYVAVGFAAGLIYRRYRDEDQELGEGQVVVKAPTKLPEPKPTSSATEDIPVAEAADLAKPAKKKSKKHKPAAASTTKDDLTKIKGIGKVFAQRFYDAGIMTYADLAGITPEAAREISGLKDWQAADPADWIAQAQALS